MREVRWIRPPAVAGHFYPSRADVLRAAVAGLVGRAAQAGPVPQALIAPHAGYEYSGPVAAAGYALLDRVRHRITRVVLLGPSHFVSFGGLAASGAAAFATPLGDVPIDREGVERALSFAQGAMREDAHAREHSLEVHLPFLQMVLERFVLVPFAVGLAEDVEVAEVIDALWRPDDTLVIASSDLSHYHDHGTARILDGETAGWITGGRSDRLEADRACGHRGIRGLLQAAAGRGLRVTALDLRTSGDTSGEKDEVVGYGTFAIHR